MNAARPSSRDDDTPLDCGDCSACTEGSGALCSGGAIAALRVDDVAVRAGATLVRAGQMPDSIRLLHRGWAYRYIQLSNGRRQVLNFLVSGDIIDIEALLLEGPPVFNVRALTDASICVLPPDGVRHAIAHAPDQRKAWLSLLRTHLSNEGRHIADIGQRSAAGRLAQLLLELYDRLSARRLTRNGAFFFPINQGLLSEALGITPVHANRTLNALRKDGLIAFERNRIMLLDLGALRAVADDR